MDYQNGKIYKIESVKGEKVYIGSTTKKYLSQRMDKHRSNYKDWKKGSDQGKYSSFVLFEEYGLDNCNIILLESCPCNSKDELRSREAHHIRAEKNCVNNVIPQRTSEEYYNDKKLIINAKSREYYATHQENRHQYLERTKEKRRQQAKERYEKQSETSECPCGITCTAYYKRKHEKTKTHLEYLSKLNPLNTKT